MTSTQINAVEFIQPQEAIIETASRVADEVVRRLANGDSVVLSLAGIRGMPSSFVNVLLHRIGQVIDLTTPTDRFRVETGTAIQSQIYQRSLDAYRAQELKRRAAQNQAP